MALLCPIALWAQSGSLDLTLKLKNMEGGNMANVTITLIEENTNERLQMLTNAQGVAHIVVTSGNRYSINFLDMEKYAYVEVPENGDRTQSKGITYVPKEYRNDAKAFDRTGVEFRTQPQQYSSRTEPTKTLSLLGFQVVDQSRKGLGNIDLAVVSVEQQTKYTARTNGAGWAYFLVPVGKRYELDVPGIEAYKQYKLPQTPYSVIEYSILFVPTKITENNSGDTVLQELTSGDKATSERIKMRVHVNTFEGEPLEGEAVYYDAQKSDKVYKALTNASGDAYFLLPKGDIYMLNLTYEREIRPLNVDSRKGAIGQGEMTVRYRGTAVIEEFYKRTKRNSEGIVIEFMETPTEEGSTTSSYYRKTAEGYELDFDEASVIYTPLVVNEKLYTSHGFYSNDFSCFNAETGEMLWSTRLGEGGASPALYHDGIILMITESCSIYGIEAESGRLAWSKWLAPYVICSPSADKGLVYAVYQNDATELTRSQNEFVLACFDLKDGSIKWQKWIDREGLASPVVAGNSVFITTLSGTLHEFDATNGELLHKLAMNAVSAPTILDEQVLVARRDGEFGQSLCVINRNNWRYDIVAAAGNYLPNAFDRMDDMEYLIPYEGSRPVIHNKLLYHTIDNVLYCRKMDGSRVWQKGLGGTLEDASFAIATSPVLIDNYVMVATSQGILLTFDAKKGTLIERTQVAEGIQNQPVVDQGNIYVGTSMGRLVVRQTGNKKYHGWSMWGFNGGHNAVIE